MDSDDYADCFAGLTAVPTDPVESAMVDGANRWQIFWKVTFPMLRPTLVIAALLRLIDALKTFDIIYSTTAGGPLFASETLNILAYTTSFSYFQMGRGSATIVLFLVVIGFASSLMIWVRRKVGIDLDDWIAKRKRSKTTFSQAEAEKRVAMRAIFYFSWLRCCSLSVSHYLDDPWLV